MRQSFTAVIARNVTWQGDFAVEPYETAWATEAIYFVRVLEAANMPTDAVARVQVSPDGVHWCDEGTEVPLSPNAGVTFARISHFGGWLRLVGKLADGAQLTVIVYLTLKE
jgi:hypothetical protein